MNLISPALLYSCRFWANHLEAENKGEFEDIILDFLKNQFLFWLEVLSCRKAYSVAIPAIESLLGPQEVC